MNGDMFREWGRKEVEKYRKPKQKRTLEKMKIDQPNR